MNEAGPGGNSVAYYARVIRRRGWIPGPDRAARDRAGYALHRAAEAGVPRVGHVKVNTQSFSDGQSTDISKDPIGSSRPRPRWPVAARWLPKGYLRQAAVRRTGDRGDDGTATPTADCKLGVPPVSPGKKPTGISSSWPRGTGRDAGCSARQESAWTARTALELVDRRPMRTRTSCTSR